jgi:hypothetical protein
MRVIGGGEDEESIKTIIEIWWKLCVMVE